MEVQLRKGKTGKEKEKSQEKFSIYFLYARVKQERKSYKNTWKCNLKKSTRDKAKEEQVAM